jgi:hypothetical protein
MNKKELTHSEFFSNLNKGLRSNGIVITLAKSASSVAGGSFADKDPRQKVTWILVRSDDRADAYSKVKLWLSNNNLKYSKQQKDTISSFDYITLTVANKEIRIVFKFKNGLDKKNFKWWNEGLNSVFKSHSNLKRTPSDRNELEIIKHINEKINELGGGNPVTLKIQNKQYTNVVGLVGGIHMKKADFVVIDNKGEEKCFISYKTGQTATSFQQYGGITSRSKLDQHREVKQFVEDVEKLGEEFFNRGKETYDDKTNEKKVIKGDVYKKIKDQHLKKMAIFGPDYGKKHGVDNVNFVVQGTPQLRMSGNVVTLFFTKKVVENGNLNRLAGDYDPVLGARKGESTRRIGRVKNARGGIYPKRYLTNRKNSINLDNPPNGLV